MTLGLLYLLTKVLVVIKDILDIIKIKFQDHVNDLINKPFANDI